VKVSTTEPFQIIYSLFEHEYLGYLFESFVIQLDHQRRLTLKHQNISAKNADEFARELDDIDFKLINLTDAIQQEAIVKKFYNKKITPAEFFLKVFHKEKGDELLQDAIRSYIELKKNEILCLLGNKMVFEMGHDGEPTWKRLAIAPEKASILFHFMRNEENTHYFPTIKYEGQKVDFQYKNAIIVCSMPAWLLVDSTIFHFKKDVDGNKLKPFLNKKFILVPRKMEETYYEKFVTQIVASFDVHAKGFTINAEEYQPKPVLTITELAAVKAPVSLFAGAGTEEATLPEENKILLSLDFQYGNFTFPSDTLLQSYVKMEKTADSYLFHKVKRNTDKEKEILHLLRNSDIEFKGGKITLEKSRVFTWLSVNRAILEEHGLIIRQNLKDGKRYFVGSSSISLEVKENNDWFDVYAVVRFGEFEIPFIKLKQHILKKKKEFVLPNGEIAVIPEEWFSQYSDLFSFLEHDNDDMKLRKHHMSLVKELQTGNIAEVIMDRKLERLRDFQEIEDYPLPEAFKGELRPYQKAGYNWMRFLNDYHFGGCLADDMGLGKTVQTLALLQSQRDSSDGQASLLIMPTSLVYNWEMESRKFTPDLRILNYTGINREKNIDQFQNYDLIITSYGTIRIDIELFKQYKFHYTILDESQVIKNPESIIARAVKELNSKHKLILTGTPVENSTMDLWSQMTFVNPGLLGTQQFFRNEFLNPIEKKHDEIKTKRLYNIIKPFILRRQKSQVVKDLPEKIENVKYCIMSPEQEQEYEKTKSNYRNLILESIDEKGLSGSQILLLQGLTKLRQIANHPKLVDETFEGTSGKMEDVNYMLDNALAMNHKILVFSQFVKHLQLYAKQLDARGIKYAYLDGSTRDRQAEVEHFQNDEGIRIFLISLKAGGLGLNLTAADYVFLLDPWWNPAVEAQAVDRAYRIGQKNTVFTYKFITQNTVEEKILNLQKNKLKLASDIISSEETFIKTLSKEDIQSIFD